MRIISLILIAALAMPVHAEPWHGPQPHGHGGGGGGDWFGFTLFAAFMALILTSEINKRPETPSEPQQPVYVEPPANAGSPPAPAANTWYYCGSSGKYYPYTQACPEGWQAVPARPQD